ncbi:MAG: hypothetical protein IPM94_15360 [bacterium]|nr:hypothetical protein [bacterium]
MFQRFVVPAARLLLAAGLAMWPAAASAWEMLSYQDDPVNMAIDESLDITAASVEQQGGRLLFTIALRGDVPASLPGPDDSQTYLWYVDADEDPSTGQNHGAVGSEFNVRAVVGETYGGGWVDITGGMPGGGVGTVTVEGSVVFISVWMDQIGNAASFNWRCATFKVIGGTYTHGNFDTQVSNAVTLPYTPPATITVTTPILQLCPSGPATGQLELDIRDANGDPMPPEDHSIVYRSTNPAVATVDENGLVTAIAPPTQHWETPYVDVTVDGVMAGNSSVIRVNPFDVGVAHQVLPASNVTFLLPNVIEGVDLAALTAQYEVVHATDAAWLAQAIGVGPDRANWTTQYLVLDVATDPVTSVCGASGNPVRLGWLWGQTEHNSCYIINDPANRRPQWFVMWHELGHNFTCSCNAFNMFLWTPSPQHNSTYGEGLASLGALWSWRMAMDYPSDLGAMARADIDGHFCDYWGNFSAALADYKANGRDYATIDADVLDGILMEMWGTYGVKCWFDLFSTFLPSQEAIPVAMDSVEKQATWFVAAMSASVGEDLRELFIEEYGFPIDEDAWLEILSVVQERVDARDFYSVGAEETPSVVAAGARLLPNVPNPFNPSTSIGFVLENASRVILGVYDLKGRLVRGLMDVEMEAGEHQDVCAWDGRNDQGRPVTSGSYILRLSTDEGSASARKAVLVR